MGQALVCTGKGCCRVGVLGGIVALVALVPSLRTKFFGAIGKPAMAWYSVAGYTEPDLEAERAKYPADEERQAEIAQMPGYSEDDTWAIYIYAVGSDLESAHQNDLSDMVRTETSLQKQENTAAKREKQIGSLIQYSDILKSENLELPGPMYYTDPPLKASNDPVTNPVVVSDRTGATSMDIDEIRKVTLPDNIKIVLQTGGATHWTNPLINPNRVQRFEFSGDAMTEIYNVPVEPVSTADALADFLKFCDDNYEADHKVLVFWDHGAGAFGFGVDEIYDQLMSIDDINKALGTLYTADSNNPEFELIGFDACLMSSAEVMNVLDGYGRYFVGSEETEPGFGWDYTGWLNQLIENPGMNGAQLGLAIADSYMDFYARLNIHFPLEETNSLTFSIVDIHEGAKVYKAYEKLAEKTLHLIGKDPSLLSQMNQAARNSIHYVGVATDAYNTIDLGIFMDNMPEELSDEVSEVRTALEKAVLYTRSDEVLEGSQGLSIYYPDHIGNTGGVIYLMNYINNISHSDAINTLYFYKSAGCLSSDMKQYLDENGIAPIANIDLTVLNDVYEAPITIGENGSYSIAVSEEAQDMMQGIGIAMGRIEDDKAIYYGIDSEAYLDGDGNLVTDFDSQWMAIDGQLLSVNVISETPYVIDYSAPVLLDGKDATLLFCYDKDKEEFIINGAYLDSDAFSADYVGRNVSDLTEGSQITPVYECSDINDGKKSKEEGKSIKYGENTAIKLVNLPDGNYLSYIYFTSTRGDEFNSGIVELKISGGKVTESNVSERFTVVNN